MANIWAEDQLRCPRCGSDQVVKRGRSKRKLQVYGCKACGRRFNDPTARDHRVRPEAVAKVINLYYDGLTTRSIIDELGGLHVSPARSPSTVYEWVHDYTRLAIEELKAYRAHTGPVWLADERTVRIGGSSVTNLYIMDAATRFLLVSHLSREDGLEPAIETLRKALARSTTAPERILTDRPDPFGTAVQHTFGGTVGHIRSEGVRETLEDNLSEHLRDRARTRMEILESLQGLENGQIFLDGWAINYNHFRVHPSLAGSTPAEAARLDAPFKSWEDFTRRDASSYAEERRQRGRTGARRRRRNPRIARQIPDTGMESLRFAVSESGLQEIWRSGLIAQELLRRIRHLGEDGNTLEQHFASAWLQDLHIEVDHQRNRLGRNLVVEPLVDCPCLTSGMAHGSSCPNFPRRPL